MATAVEVRCVGGTLICVPMDGLVYFRKALETARQAAEEVTQPLLGRLTIGAIGHRFRRHLCRSHEARHGAPSQSPEAAPVKRDWEGAATGADQS